MAASESRSDHRPLPRGHTARVPVLLFVGTILVVSAMFGALLLAQARSAVDLGPAVGAAERVEVRLTLCNADVDRLEINPRATELRLEELLREEGAAASQVVVDRRDCPMPPG